jgi:hypothetical protein
MLENIDDGPPGPRGGSDPHPRSKRPVVNLHGYDRQKGNSAHGSHFSPLGPVMDDDP